MEHPIVVVAASSGWASPLRWIALLSLVLAPALSVLLPFRFCVPHGSKGSSRVARWGFQWLSSVETINLGSWGILMILFQHGWNRGLPWPLLAVGLVLLCVIQNGILGLATEVIHRSVQDPDDRTWKNVLPPLYFKGLIRSPLFVGLLFVPLGILRSVNGLEVRWEVVGTYCILQVVLFLEKDRIFNLLFHLETPPGEELRQLLERYRGSYRTCVLLKTHGARLVQSFALPVKRKLVVTDGLLEELNEDEMDGVLCHEIGHFQNRGEVLGRSFFELLIPAFFCLSLTSVPVILDVVREDPESSGTRGLQALVLGTILFALLALWISRWYLKTSRHWERDADLYAVEHCLNPEAYASALVRLHGSLCPPYHSQPKGWGMETHPDLEARLEAIRSHPRFSDRGNPH